MPRVAPVPNLRRNASPSPACMPCRLSRDGIICNHLQPFADRISGCLSSRMEHLEHSPWAEKLRALIARQQKTEIRTDARVHAASLTTAHPL